MNATLVNPFLNRTAIREDEAFVGRTHELKRVFNRIGGAQPQSVSIVGDRRIGKSSLLRALIARRGTFLTRPDAYVFAYLDMQSRLRWTPEMFFGRLVEEIAASAPALARPAPTYDGIEQFARSLQTSGHSLVVLVDEFHVLMRDEQHDAPLPLEFFNYLRSLANSYAVSLIVTSHVDLYTLSADHRLSGSPLFNILHKLHLGPFSPGEAKELIETPSALRGCSLSVDREWILSQAGFHPLYLQIACSAAFEWRAEHGQQLPLDTTFVEQRFVEEAQPHFEGTWRLLSSLEQEMLALVSLSGQLSPGHAPVVDGLVQRGYLRLHGAQPRVFSESFRQFVLKHQSDPMSSGVVAATTPPPARRARLFLSYASEDREPVKALYRKLQHCGMQPWMDDEDLIAGDPWARKIDEAIATADFFLVCLSTRSVDKAGVLQKELSRGIDRWYSRSSYENYLIPVMLEECPLPPTLSHVQKVDLWHDDGWTRLRHGLELALHRRLPDGPELPEQASPPAAPGESAEAALTIDYAQALLHRYGLKAGIAMLIGGVVLLFGGLSGNALSQLIGVVGLQRARNWNVALRILEVTALVGGAGLVCNALLRARTKWRGFSGAVALSAAVLLLVNVTVPAPSAFALAYGRYLDDQSVVWRRLLMGFFDQATGGIRDVRDDRRVQAWTTAQTIVGVLANVGYDNKQVPKDLRRTFEFLEKVRLGPPENGWGYFANKDDAITEITAWVALAEMASLRAAMWPPEQRTTMEMRLERDLRAIQSRQTGSGGFSPIDDVRNGNARTYSTVVALWALAEALELNLGDDQMRVSASNGMDWLLETRDRDLGWIPNPGRRYQTEEFPGLTAQALVILDRLQAQLPDRARDPRLIDAKRRFTESSFDGASIPINARVPDTDVHVDTNNHGMILEGTSFLWYPWARTAFALLEKDQDLAPAVRTRAARQLAALTLRTEELTTYLNNGLPYQLAENLLSIRLASHPR